MPPLDNKASGPGGAAGTGTRCSGGQGVQPNGKSVRLKRPSDLVSQFRKKVTAESELGEQAVRTGRSEISRRGPATGAGTAVSGGRFVLFEDSVLRCLWGRLVLSLPGNRRSRK